MIICVSTKNASTWKPLRTFTLNYCCGFLNRGGCIKIMNFNKAVSNVLKHECLCVPEGFVLYLPAKRHSFNGKITGYSDGERVDGKKHTYLRY